MNRDVILGIETFNTAWLNKPFSWGVADCACLVNSAFWHIGKQDIAPMMGAVPYDNEAAGWKQLKANGFKSLIDWVDSFAEQIPVARAMTGDIIGYPSDSKRWRVALGVVISDSRAMAANPETGTFEHAAVGGATHAWRLKCLK